MLDAEEDPLKWWIESQRIYPRLSKLARKYLCIPATSSSSERVKWKHCHLLAFIS